MPARCAGRVLRRDRIGLFLYDQTAGYFSLAEYLVDVTLAGVA